LFGVASQKQIDAFVGQQDGALELLGLGLAATGFAPSRQVLQGRE
jgi:hypothetical protein